LFLSAKVRQVFDTTCPTNLGRMRIQILDMTKKLETNALAFHDRDYYLVRNFLTVIVSYVRKIEFLSLFFINSIEIEIEIEIDKKP
jgi:hypothetical protein